MSLSKYPLVDECAKYFWSKNGQEEFSGFFTRYAPLFLDAPLKEQGGEQDLEFYAIFKDYLKIYEDVLEGYIEKLDGSQEDFYRQLQDIQEDKNIKDKKLLHFCNYLIGCTDYPSFYKMMVRAAKKYKAAAKEEPSGGGGAGEKGEVAEGKEVSRGEGAGGKGERDDSDSKDCK